MDAGEKIVVSVLLAIVGSFSVAKCSGLNPTYSDGTRIGTVQKFSRKGVIWKSYEGVMLMDGMRTQKSGESTVLVNNSFQFSCTDETIAKQINDAMATGSVVTLSYDEWLLSPWSQDTGYCIKSVKSVQK